MKLRLVIYSVGIALNAINAVQAQSVSPSPAGSKSAILAIDSTIIHYGRLHALLTQGSPIKVRIFQDRQEAAQWLNAPIALLMPDAAETS